MSELSVIIITKNAQTSLDACLNAVSFADEIIILDSGSTDNTLAIAKKHTPHVYETDWPGYGIQKGRALSKATKPWVLSIDADEIMGEALAAEIQQVIKHTSGPRAYRIPIQLVFEGKEIKYANGKSLHLRLFQREHAQFSEEQVHEKVILTGEVGTLKHTLFHHSFDSINDLLVKINRYSSLNAHRPSKAHKPTGMFQAISHGLWAFIKIYLLKRGFLDGSRGFVLAVYFAENAYYKQIKRHFNPVNA